MTETIQVRLAGAADASGMLHVNRTTLVAHRLVDPPAGTLSDTLADVEHALAERWGVYVLDGDHMVGCLLVARDGEAVRLRRVSMLPSETRRGITKAMIGRAMSFTVDAGLKRVEVLCRREFPELAGWWGKHGFGLLRENASGTIFGRDPPVVVTVSTPDATHVLGVELAGLPRMDDVVIATGEFGIDKTTLARGIGEGLDVKGPAVSPIFALSCIHPSRDSGPDLVHVDVYCMAGTDELTDVDLDAMLPRSVTLVEQDKGVAERLSNERLKVDISREIGDEARRVTLTGVSPRWADILEVLRRNL